MTFLGLISIRKPLGPVFPPGTQPLRRSGKPVLVVNPTGLLEEPRLPRVRR